MKQFNLFLLFSLLLFTISCDQNEIFQPCDNTIIWYVDADGDGYGTGDAVEPEDCFNPEGYATNNSDCDDTNADIFEEISYYQDMDNDGYGNPEVEMIACAQPEGYVANSIDCDDEDANSSTAQNYYADNDGDGYGAGDMIVTCSPESNYVTDGTDCDDTNANVWEGQTYYQDADGDGLGNPDVSVYACEQPDGYVSNNNDDNDSTGDTGGNDNQFGYFYNLVIGNSWVHTFNGQEQVSEVKSSEDDNGVTKYTVSTTYNSSTNDGLLWYPNNVGYAQVPLGPNQELVPAVFLDDNKAVGETWEDVHTLNQSGIDVVYTYEYEVIEVLASYQLPNGNSYNNVKKVHQKLVSSIAGTPPTVLSNSDYYWAKGIGLVYFYSEDSTGTEIGEQMMVSYNFP